MTYLLRSFWRRIRPLRSRTPAKPCVPRRITVLRTDANGDHIIFGAFLRQLRLGFPSAEITLVLPTARQHLYECCDVLDVQIAYDHRAAMESSASRKALYKRIRAGKADWMINPMLSRPIMSERMMRHCPASVRIGFASDDQTSSAKQGRRFDPYYDWLINVPPGRPWNSELESCMQMLLEIGLPIADYRPQIWTSKADRDYAEDVFATSTFPRERTLVYFAGATEQTRSYPLLGQVMAELLSLQPWRVIAIGGREHFALNEPPREDLRPRWLNLSGACTIRESAELMRRCRLVIGVETGLVQAACAVGAPQVVVIGGGYFGRFLPHDPLTTLVCHPVDCFFCRGHCRYDRPYCLTQIHPSLVKRAIEDSLNSNSSRSRVYVQTEFNPAPRPSLSVPSWHWKPEWVNPITTEIIWSSPAPVQ